MQRFLQSRRAYLVLLAGFLGVLFLAGRGRTKSMWGFQRRINIRLQQIERDLFYDNRAEGVIVAKGPGVFEFLDLAEPWARYRAGEGDIDSAAADIARQVTAAREFAATLPPWEEARERIVAVSMPRAAVHPLLKQAEAAAELALASEARLPLYLLLPPPSGEEGDARVLLKEHLAGWTAEDGRALTPRAVAAAALARANAAAYRLEADAARPDVYRVVSETPGVPAGALLPPARALLRPRIEAALAAAGDNDTSPFLLEVWRTGLDEVYLRASPTGAAPSEGRSTMPYMSIELALEEYIQNPPEGDSALMCGMPPVGIRAGAWGNSPPPLP